MDALDALELAELMYGNSESGHIIDGVTYYYLPVKYHLFCINTRPFGMKFTIRHTKRNKLRIGELATAIWVSSEKVEVA